MKLDEIKSIKNVRNFLNFNGTNAFLCKKIKKQGGFDSCNETVIYAPNGTGKTNLSRIFCYIPNPEKNIEDLLSLEANQNVGELSFSFCFDGNIIDEQNFKSNENQKILNNCYVFNSDYVEENVRCNNFSDKNINGTVSITLGKENINIQLLKSEIDLKSSNRKKYKDTLITNIEKIKKGLRSSKYKGNDISIWQEFDLNKIINDRYEILIPTKKEKFDYCEDNFLKIKNLTLSNKIQYSLAETPKDKTDVLDKLFSFLKEEKTFSKFDKETESKISDITKNWIGQSLLKEGIRQSEEHKKCLLCDRNIDSSVETLFEKYKNYFEDEKGKFEGKVEQFKRDLQLLKVDLQKINNNLQSETEELIKVFSLKQNWADLSTETMIKEIETFEQLLDSKKSNPQICPKFKQDIKTEIEKLNQKIKYNSAIVTDINKRIDNSNSKETELRKTIGQKYLYDLYINNKNIFDDITSLNIDIEKGEKNLKIEQDKLPKIDMLSNVVDLFNVFLHDFVGLNKYTAKIVNNSISLHLNDVDISKETKKISEGEKTMIAFCYFLAASIQKFNSPEKYKDSIFIIDDPICSTSYGNFFGICNLSNEFENKIYKKFWNKEQKPKVQKILLTHNTQFFNMLRNNVFKEKATYFILNEKGLKTILPKQLISEFETALCRIYEASKDTNYDGNVGNDMRRFFETVRHFYGFHQFEADSVKSIFTGFEESTHKEFYAAINYYSHGNPEANTDPIPPENMSKLLEEFVSLIEKSQFKDLWNNVKKLAN